jgi:para-nitrobenzyl esterase
MKDAQDWRLPRSCGIKSMGLGQRSEGGEVMTFERSRREFLKQGSVLAAVASCGSGLALRAVAQGRYVEARTAYGRVRGVDVGGVKTFKGIPYGASTAGENRFMPPGNPASWSGVRDALEYGPSAPQREPGAGARVSPLAVAAAGLPAESEDCLVLNVWTPGVGDGGKRPVMFWCHGGGFVSGSGSSPVTDGANLARRGDVVVVSINHRLNVLGFTYLGELGGESFERTGDAGMLDIVHALNWVHANISEFGGDPDNVTVFGQSGGGRKVATLLAMPSAKGLFHRAIIESGATLKLVEREQAARVARELLATANVPPARFRDLKQMPLGDLMRAYFATVRRMNVDQMTMGFSPTMEGSVVAQHPFHPTAAAVSADVPLVVGSTRTELTLGADAAAFSLDEAGLKSRAAGLFGDASGHLLDVYRKANPGASPSDLYFLLASDERYSAPVMKIAERRAALHAGPVYLYYFRWESPLDGGRYKAPHTIEIPFAFHNLEASRLTASAADAPALADQVSDAWLAFARTGTPNAPSLPRWPAFDAEHRQTMVFDNESRVANDPIGAQRVAMFAALGLEG